MEFQQLIIIIFIFSSEKNADYTKVFFIKITITISLFISEINNFL